jgi:hypothetical protein
MRAANLAVNLSDINHALAVRKSPAGLWFEKAEL